MMDFMDNLRRGVDRAGFEVDRLLRANRVRSRIGTIRSQIDEELRQVGRRVVELYGENEPLPEAVRQGCETVKRYEAEIARLEAELEAINSEVPPDVEAGPLAATAPRCPRCGHLAAAGANFCSNCGAGLAGGEAGPETEVRAEESAGS